MDENFKKLAESLKITESNVRYAAKVTGNDTGLLLTACADMIQAQMKMIEYLSVKFETEKSIKNRCFDFICNKGLLDEFYQK
mgnify:CR=1 FL=1|jgi:hypothetical protein